MNDGVLSKIIRNNFIVYKFASKMLWLIISKAKKAGITNIDDYIKSDIFVSGNVIILNKSGIPISTHLLDAKNYVQFLKILQLNHIKFLQIMGAIYKFTYDTKFITKIVAFDLDLQNLIVEKFRIYFAVPPDFNFDDLQELISKSKGDWFIPWLITYTTSSKQNLVRHNLNYDSDYVRAWIKSDTTPQYINACSDKLLESDIGLCTKDQKVQILKGNSHYQPVKDGIFENVMKKYGKEVIAGPSGSSVMTYQLVFNILKICKGTKDKIMLLLCIIGDYYPVHHSIPEILMIYPEEADLPHYNLSMNAGDYLRELVGEYVPEIKFSMAFTKRECDDAYFDDLDTFLDQVIKESQYQPDLVQKTENGTRSCPPLSLNDCKADSFHPDSAKVQVLLGRFGLTTNCFTDCPGVYTALNIPIWSIFRNDLFIRYIASRNEKLDSIFPIRVILSNNQEFFIPPHNMRIVKHIQLLLNEYFTEYTWDQSDFESKNDITEDKITPNIENKELAFDMSQYSKLMNDKIKKAIVAFPSSNIVSRELCMLRKLHFYMVLRHKKVYLPFILISHLSKYHILKWYSDNNKHLEGQLKEIF
uniref:Uncharacterized protein n=1 Tax=viral metagenome TaxID=1070528 RepID=A0A6C0KSE3_9ZZZZ